MTAPELKPCPFCGGDAEFERKGDRRMSTIVTCTYCGASHECGEEWDHGRTWNTRTPTLADALALPEVKALVEALEHCLGTITCGMDGVWDHFVKPQDLARAALAALTTAPVDGEKK